MTAPAAPARIVRVVIEARVPAGISEGDFLAALPQRDSLLIPVGDGERTVRPRLRYRRFSAVVAPVAAIEAAATALERAGTTPFAITATLRGAVRQLKGA